MPIKAKQVGGVGGGRLLYGGATGFLASTPDLVWDYSNNRLGILIALPLASLHVDGSVILGGAAVVGTASRTRLIGGAGSVPTLALQNAAGTGDTDEIFLLVEEDGSSLFGIDSKGRVLGADGGLARCAYAFRSDVDTGLFLPAAGELGLVAGGVERARVTATGVREYNVISAPSSNVADGGERYTDAGATWWRSLHGLRTQMAGAGTAHTTSTFLLRDSEEGTSSDGVEFLLASVKLPEASIVSFSWDVVAYQTGGGAGTVGDSFGGTRQVRAGRKGAADARLLGAHTLGTDDDELGGALLRFDVDGDELQLFATGVGDKGLSWSASYTASMLASPS